MEKLRNSLEEMVKQRAAKDARAYLEFDKENIVELKELLDRGDSKGFIDLISHGLEGSLLNNILLEIEASEFSPEEKAYMKRLSLVDSELNSVYYCIAQQAIIHAVLELQ